MIEYLKQIFYLVEQLIANMFVLYIEVDMYK